MYWDQISLSGIVKISLSNAWSFVQGICAVPFREIVKQPITLSRFKFKFTTHFSTARGPSEVAEGLWTLESDLNLNLDSPTNLLAVQTLGKLLLCFCPFPLPFLVGCL